MTVLQFGDHVPRIAPGVWVASSATVVGQVEIEAEASIWYGAVVRGDNDRIRVGARSNVQECAVLHTDDGYFLDVGPRVTVGHQAMLHGCTIGEGSLIGIRSVILNGARIGRFCMVGAGSLVPEGREYPDGVLILGTPAKAVRELTPEQIEHLRWASGHYVAQAIRHRDHTRPVPA